MINRLRAANDWKMNLELKKDDFTWSKSIKVNKRLNRSLALCSLVSSGEDVATPLLRTISWLQLCVVPSVIYLQRCCESWSHSPLDYRSHVTDCGSKPLTGRWLLWIPRFLQEIKVFYLSWYSWLVFNSNILTSWRLFLTRHGTYDTCHKKKKKKLCDVHMGCNLYVL